MNSVAKDSQVLIEGRCAVSANMPDPCQPFQLPWRAISILKHKAAESECPRVSFLIGPASARIDRSQPSDRS